MGAGEREKRRFLGCGEERRGPVQSGAVQRRIAVQSSMAGYMKVESGGGMELGSALLRPKKHWNDFFGRGTKTSTRFAIKLKGKEVRRGGTDMKREGMERRWGDWGVEGRESSS